MIRYQGQWVQEQIGPKTNYYGPPGVGNYQRQTPNAASPKVLQPRGGQVMDGPGFNYPGSQRPAGPGAPSPRPGSGRIMDGPDSGFNYPGTGGRFPRPEPPPGMEYARSQEDSPQDAKKVFAGAEPRRNGGGQPPGGDMYAGGTPYFDERTGGGFPQPPAGGVQGWQRPGAAQPIQPQSQGTPYGQQGYDVRRAPGNPAGPPMPPGQGLGGPGPASAGNSQPSPARADTSWQPNPDDYRRSVMADQSRAARQDSEAAAQRQKMLRDRQGVQFPEYANPIYDPIVIQNEMDERVAQANARGRGEAVAADSRLDGPITAADEKATIGTGQSRQTVADLKRQRQRAHQQRQEGERARQQAQSEYEGVRSEFPGVSDDTLHHIIKKRNQERIAAGRAAAERELGPGSSAPPRPAGGFTSLPNAGMPQNVDPGFNAMRNSPLPPANNEEFQQWKESGGYSAEPAVYNPQKSQQRDALLYDKFTQERKAGSWVPKAPLAPVYQQDRTGEARRQALLRGIPADKLKKSQAPTASQQDQRFNNWMAKDGMYAKQDSSQLRAVQQYQQDPLAALRAAGFRI